MPPRFRCNLGVDWNCVKLLLPVPLKNRAKTRDDLMSVALWCMDCKQAVNLDLHGNCEHCGNPEVSVVGPLQPLTFRQKMLRMKESRWALAAAVSIALFGAGLTIWAIRQTE
jgi:hypothetical protein